MSSSFGQTLRELRKAARVGLRELARLTGKSAGYLSDVELGRVAPPSEEVILEIAAALQVDRQVLLKAARKVDPEVARYVAGEPLAADFLRQAKARGFGGEDWQRLLQLADIAQLGRRRKQEEEDR